MNKPASATITKNGLVISTAAIEVGFGVTKWAYRNSSVEVIKNQFPSICPTYNHAPEFDAAVLQKRDTYVIPINGSMYEVGPDVFLAQHVGNSGRTLNDQFPESDHYFALVIGAIMQMKAKEIHHLVLGLPVHTMQRYKDFLKERFKGEFKLNDHSIVIGKVSVIQQPVGSLVYAAQQGFGISDGVNHLIIDPGYYSTDWVVANGFRVLANRSGGMVSGVSPIIKKAASLIGKELNVSFSQFERLGDALKNKTALTVYKHTLSNDECWEYVRRSSSGILDCLKEIDTKIGVREDIKSVILSGGGGIFYLDSCKDYFSDVNVHLVDDSGYANCIGFLLAGENIG
jgi:plasmid segregation protein ParM